MIQSTPRTVDEVIILTFEHREDEVCVVIQQPLNNNSAIETVMVTGDVLSDFNIIFLDCLIIEYVTNL